MGKEKRGESLQLGQLKVVTIRFEQMITKKGNSHTLYKTLISSYGKAGKSQPPSR